MKPAGRIIPLGIGAVVLSLAGMLVLPAGARFAPRPSWLPTTPQQDPVARQGREPFKTGVEVCLVMVPVTVHNPGGGFIKNTNAFDNAILESLEETC